MGPMQLVWTMLLIAPLICALRVDLHSFPSEYVCLHIDVVPGLVDGFGQWNVSKCVLGAEV
jgi:hypothetical protein